MAGLFDPISFRGMHLKNRIMVSPMCQYQAKSSGDITEWHIVHYGSLALSGAALIFVEATAVEPRGRISNQDVGIYSDSHVEGLRRIVDFAHNQDVRIGIQLGHAGRKAGLEEKIIAPSKIAFSERYQTPLEATPEDLTQVVDAFRKGAKRAVAAGFDCIEIHAAHGYLLHQFLSPISNHRTDDFGGSRENRLRFPLQVVRAVREAVPENMPVFVRVSGSEYSAEGYSMDEMVWYCAEFQNAGADLIDVSSGGNLRTAPPNVYAGYQVPFAHAIRQGANVPVASVGMLDDAIFADSILQEGRADLIAIGRGFLRNKNWGHDAAILLKHPVHPPKSYERAY